MTRFVTIVRQSLIAAAIAAPLPALAAPEAAPAASVHYADLDLASPRGQRQLHGRLTSAARQACETSTRSGSMAQTERSACMARAMASAETEFAALVSASAPRVAAAETDRATR
jgi:UrcA family protein